MRGRSIDISSSFVRFLFSCKGKLDRKAGFGVGEGFGGMKLGWCGNYDEWNGMEWNEITLILWNRKWQLNSQLIYDMTCLRAYNFLSH